MTAFPFCMFFSRDGIPLLLVIRYVNGLLLVFFRYGDKKVGFADMAIKGVGFADIWQSLLFVIRYVNGLFVFSFLLVRVLFSFS